MPSNRSLAARPVRCRSPELVGRDRSGASVKVLLMALFRRLVPICCAWVKGNSTCSPSSPTLALSKPDGYEELLIHSSSSASHSQYQSASLLREGTASMELHLRNRIEHRAETTNPQAPAMCGRPQRSSWCHSISPDCSPLALRRLGTGRGSIRRCSTPAAAIRSA